MDVPDFHGRLHLEDFLDCLSSVEKFFEEKARYAKVKFLSTGHTSIWWDQVQARRERKGQREVHGTRCDRGCKINFYPPIRPKACSKGFTSL